MATVNRVIGWKAGEFDYDITPAVFTTAEELDAGFLYNDFCGGKPLQISDQRVPQGGQDSGVSEALRYL